MEHSLSILCQVNKPKPSDALLCGGQSKTTSEQVSLQKSLHEEKGESEDKVDR